MAKYCTLFSIAEAELSPPSDGTLPPHDDASSRLSQITHPHTLELGPSWQLLHAAAGNHTGDHPLAFMVSGGEAFAALDDGSRSSGRYFPPSRIGQILEALDKLSDRQVARNVPRPAPPKDVQRHLGRLREFLAEVVAAGDRGLIVYAFN
jgi:hypothetical protein